MMITARSIKWRLFGAVVYLCSVVAGAFFMAGSSAAAKAYIPYITAWHGLLIAGGLMAATGALARSHRLEAGGCCGLAGSYSAYVVALGLQAADTGIPTLVGLAGMIAGLVGLLLLRIGALVESIRIIGRLDAGGTDAS